MAVSDDDLNNLAWTMLGEARPGDTAGMTAVGNTVLNREASGKYGTTITTIVKAPNQYAAWGIGKQAAGQNQHMQDKYPVTSAQFQQAKALATQLVNGEVPDNTGGAVDYRAASAGTSWANGRQTVNIGGNIFALPAGASIPRDNATPQLAYTGSPSAVQSDGLSAIDHAMGTYGNQTSVPLPQPRPTGGTLLGGGAVGAGSGVNALATLAPSPAGFDSIGAGPGSFAGLTNALAQTQQSSGYNGPGANTVYVRPDGSTYSPQLSGTVAMPFGARPASIPDASQTSNDIGAGPGSYAALQQLIGAGQYLSPSTTYTHAQMETANPAYLAYIAAQKADPIGQGPGSFSNLQGQVNALAPAPPQTITTSQQHAAPSTAVSNLQTILQQAGYNPGGIDGLYGPNTTAAVKAFQTANGLTADGIVGPQTLAKLAPAPTPAAAPAPVAAPVTNATQNFLSDRGGSNSGINALAPVQANNLNYEMQGGHGHGSFGV